MGYSLDIDAVRHELGHAADHLSEVLDLIDKPYHDGEAAPETVISLLGCLNAIEESAQTARQALTAMMTGGLAENDGENWYVGGHGPFDTLAEALDWRADHDDESDFVLQHDQEA